MKSRDYFLREDLTTYKPKFKLLCHEKGFKTEKLVQKFGDIVKKGYICVIKITEL